ncbi:hypothetical protein O9X98_05090 [Agrobacterium salinitolerans]|nr:hypothetical protein [Agrobacterium salinitolerans]
MPKKTLLYHGTLARHLPAIAETGLVPLIGSFTEKTFGKASDRVIPAVFMAGPKDLERVVHAMVAAIMDEVTEEDFSEWDIREQYHLNDELFVKYGAILVIEKNDGFKQAGTMEPAEPIQAEDGDWFSLEAVRPAKTLTGDELLEFLAGRDLVPSAINDFVDPDSIPAGSRPIPKPPFDLG